MSPKQLCFCFGPFQVGRDLGGIVGNVTLLDREPGQE
jgi:hypothetical protein